MSELKITDVRANKGDAAFLIDDGKTSILYDTGFAFTGYSVAENVKRLLGERTLDYIFLTHSHYDHALGSVYLRKVYKDVKIVAGEYASKIFAKPTARALMRELDKKFAQKCGFSEYEDLIDELSVDICVSDSQHITAGDMDFEVIALPGHTKCSVGYYCKEHKLLLSCETIGVYCGGKTIIPSYLVGYQITLDSISKIKNYDIKRILVPHYALLDENETEFYLENAETSAKELAKDITRMLKEGISKSEILEFFKSKYYTDSVKEIYPEDAMLLNTSITIDLIEKELL